MLPSETLSERLVTLLDRLEALLPAAPSAPDWGFDAYRWRKGRGLLGLSHPHRLSLDDILCVEAQRAEIERNTRQFLAGRGANNVLLWGARGTGKSSLVKAVHSRLHVEGLRLIEIDKDDLIDLADILTLIRDRPERFVAFCDDLSFEAGEAGYKALKAALEGSVSATPENLLIYATSNRRHLLPELQEDNREAHLVHGEIHHGEGVDEKISLSDRFGLWISFHPFSQGQYLQIVRHWLRRLGVDGDENEDAERAALQWALRRGSRSGRTAWQFARDWAGRVT